jgi:hypothetical protein
LYVSDFLQYHQSSNGDTTAQDLLLAVVSEVLRMDADRTALCGGNVTREILIEVSLV